MKSPLAYVIAGLIVLSFGLFMFYQTVSATNFGADPHIQAGNITAALFWLLLMFAGFLLIVQARRKHA